MVRQHLKLEEGKSVHSCEIPIFFSSVDPLKWEEEKGAKDGIPPGGFASEAPHSCSWQMNPNVKTGHLMRYLVALRRTS
jgi:hypothetical protein